ncbi:hypothetical protein DITRI_Ditri20bG0115700 [Diplodiscus trichospermus]
MGKIWVEVCLISAQGLRHSSSFWKLQWFAVGWIDPNNKYCTKIDASGNSDPVWNTKFAALFDDSNFQDMMLHVEVYSREPIFLTERLQGTATVVLKEFMAKYSHNSASSRAGNKEVGSYQLHKRNSNKSQGLVDISIHISEEREKPCSFPGKEGGLVLMDRRTKIALSTGGGSGHTYPAGEKQQPLATLPPPLLNPKICKNAGKEGGLVLTDHRTNIALSTEGGSGHTYPAGEKQPPLATLPLPDDQSRVNISYKHSVSNPTNHSNPSLGEPSHPSASGPSYPPRGTPSPPPPPSNVGYIPTFLPRTHHLTETYLNMPLSATAPGRGLRPGFAMGVGGGALAAGAVIFGDDFMSGFDVPAGLEDASLTISTEPPF